MSKVYFTDMRTRSSLNMLDKLEKLLKKAGLAQIDFKDKFVALKIHFGEPGNLAYIRPDYVKRIVKIIKELGGKPFLTDCNTLYFGRRSNGVDHLGVASEHGFNPLSCDCNVIIGDGIRGSDQTLVPIELEYVKTAKIGTAIADADIIISINHFKGHQETGFGGALKNLGMGCGSRAGKQEMHSSSKPKIISSACVGCGFCAKNCASHAIEMQGGKAEIDYDKCVGCGQCIVMCSLGACTTRWDEDNKILCCKMAEYTYAVLKDKPNFHINFLMNISPNCDCWSSNDAAIVPDIGILASFDPIAIDCASADLVNKAHPNKNSVLGEIKDDFYDERHSGDKFALVHPDSDWKSTVLHGEKIGLGKMQYELFDI